MLHIATWMKTYTMVFMLFDKPTEHGCFGLNVFAPMHTPTHTCYVSSVVHLRRQSEMAPKITVLK